MNWPEAFVVAACITALAWVAVSCINMITAVFT